MPKRLPRVALLIETSREYGRGLLRGVMRYVRGCGGWSLYFRPAGLSELPQAWLRDWEGDGILVRADAPRTAAAVRASGVPAVELRFPFRDLGLPAVGIDNRAVAELAFRHLWERGFRSFGYCGLPARTDYWSDFRGVRFQEFVAAAGGRCRRFPARRDPQAAGSWGRELSRIADWLASLPKPAGVMACYDDRALQVLEACRAAGLNVPDEVAVVGVDNDEFLSSLSSPPLSSVDIGVERVGYRAAELLDRMMAGASAPEGRTLLPPVGVVARRSTDALAIEDRELAELVRFIRENACDGVRVEEAFRRAALSYSTLKRRFKALLGRSPKEEIVRIQLDRARQLLTETDLSATEIAERCGFSELKRLSQVFRNRIGLSPGAYRRLQRPLSSSQERRVTPGASADQ